MVAVRILFLVVSNRKNKQTVMGEVLTRDNDCVLLVTFEGFLEQGTIFGAAQSPCVAPGYVATEVPGLLRKEPYRPCLSYLTCSCVALNRGVLLLAAAPWASAAIGGSEAGWTLLGDPRDSFRSQVCRVDG